MSLVIIIWRTKFHNSHCVAQEVLAQTAAQCGVSLPHKRHPALQTTLTKATVMVLTTVPFKTRFEAALRRLKDN